MGNDDLAARVEATATEYGIPGMAAGIWCDGAPEYGCHGVTSLDNPLPVTPDTLYVLGSVTKTYTATAVLALVAAGQVELAAPVRRYLPELRLVDEQAAGEITIAHLLSHTAGLDWGITEDTGEGDDALARYVDRLSGLKLIAAPGSRASYSQAGYNLLGRVIEKVTGRTYERAIGQLLLEPLGLRDSFFARDDVMTRRFAVGHNADADGTLRVARLWRRWRGENPGGGLVSSVADQLAWARFHLGETDLPGVPDGPRRQMREPTVRLRASALGDAIGLGWFLREVDGVATVGHGGSANGQFAELLLVPQRGFAVVSLTNAGPDGTAANKAFVRWALATYLDVHDRDPRPLPYDPTRADELIGRYDNEVMTMSLDSDGTGLILTCRMRPEIRAAADKELPPDYPPAGLGLLPGDGDEYVLTDGGMAGQRGFFTRDATGAVTGIDLAGRLFTRTR